MHTSLPLTGWSGRAPAPAAIEAGQGRQRRGARHVRGRDEDCSSPPAHLWTGRAVQEESSSEGHAVRVNLSGLCLELVLRAIMEIRAQLSSLDPRPQGPCAGPGFSCAGKTIVPSSSFPLANLGGVSITFCLAATTVMPLLARTQYRIRVRDRAPSRRYERACWPTPQQGRFMQSPGCRHQPAAETFSEPSDRWRTERVP